MIKDYEFKGYDFYELVECFWDDLKNDDLTNNMTGSEIEKLMVERLQECLRSKCSYPSPDKEIASKVREFIDALCLQGEKHDFQGRYIWEGLKKTEDDVIMVRYLTDCIWNLWN